MGHHRLATGVRDRQPRVQLADATARASIGQQNGMLTVQAGSGSGTVEVWPDDTGAAATNGRWEARIRAYERSSTGTPYRFTWELVPVSGDDACGANRIVLGSYVPG